MTKQNLTINPTLINKYNIKGPRYTSYPTTPEWKGLSEHPQQVIFNALTEVKKSDTPLSLYIHIPFCEQLCYFCSCSMIPQGKKQTEKSLHYLDLLTKEMHLIKKKIGVKKVAHLHLGGGTPNFFPAPIMKKLFKNIQQHFDLSNQLEQSIEVDPRHLNPDYIKTFHQIGTNRISMGIQDFDLQVQKAINRIQPYELIKTTCEHIRQYKTPINFDLVYGLPKQNLKGFYETCQKVISLQPDRIALYSFAFLPHMKKHHTIFKETDLPSPQEKIDIFIQSRNQLLKAGYEPIGMDHFALPQDSLSKQFANKKLFRNFMGYSLKYTKNMIGMGFSSISFIQDTYLKNTKNIQQYEQDLNNNKLPIVNGHKLHFDDKVRKWCIDKIMCEFNICKTEFKQKFNKNFDDYFTKENTQFELLIKEGFLTNTKESFKTTPLGQFFVRNIAIVFDAYFSAPQGFKGFSKTV